MVQMILNYAKKLRVRNSAKRVLKGICTAESTAILTIPISDMNPAALAMDTNHSDRILKEFPGADPNLASVIHAFLDNLQKQRELKLNELTELAASFDRHQVQVKQIETVQDKDGNVLDHSLLQGEHSHHQNALAAKKRAINTNLCTLVFHATVALLASFADISVIFATQQAYYANSNIIFPIGMTIAVVALVAVPTHIGVAPLFQWALGVTKGDPAFVAPSRQQITLWTVITVANIAFCAFVAVQRAEVFLSKPSLTESVMNFVFTTFGLPILALVAHIFHGFMSGCQSRHTEFKKDYEETLVLAQAAERELVRVLVALRKSTPYRKEAARILEKDFEVAKGRACHELSHLPMIASEIDRIARLIAEPVASSSLASGTVAVPSAAPPLQTPATPTPKSNPVPAAPLNIVGGGNNGSHPVSGTKGTTP